MRQMPISRSRDPGPQPLDTHPSREGVTPALPLRHRSHAASPSAPAAGDRGLALPATIEAETQGDDVPRFTRTIEAARASTADRAFRKGWNYTPPELAAAAGGDDLDPRRVLLPRPRGRHRNWLRHCMHGLAVIAARLVPAWPRRRGQRRRHPGG